MDKDTDSWRQRTTFVGFDWAGDHHDVVVVNQHGKIVEDFRFDDTAEGWQLLIKKLSKYPDVAVAIETSSGATVERLLEAGYAVYPVNPKAAKRYRERKAPSGTKTDHLDAWSLADALRLDGHTWRQVKADDPLTVELRLLCRDEIALIEQRTAFVCQLRAALHEYYPVALQAFDDWTLRSAWAFVEAFPTPAALAKAGKRKWEKFLHTHKLYSPATYQKRLDLFAQAETFCGSQATTNAKSMLAVALAGQLRVLQSHLDKFRKEIEKLFAKHPDHDVFGSLPGAGEKLAPRLLAELGDDRERFDSHEALQCHTGTAPVSYQSGQIKRVRFRRACQTGLRHTVHLWANLSRAKCPWAETYYRKKRDEGQSHACALRCLGQRWLKILWKMWQTHRPYDAELHQRNQVKHGSWVIALTTVTPEQRTTAEVG
ncbi:MAG: IS110 family RNA-guided transposase [Planctomycetota bacterium]|jgi:transposase